MSEASQMLLRHILEAPYPDSSVVCTIKEPSFSVRLGPPPLLIRHDPSAADT
jgi:hypothetical protein